jgi:hypothetical protein
MTIEERYNIQKKGIEIPNRLKENDIVDNYIQSRMEIREKLQEQENKELIPKKVIEDIKKQIIKKIEDN